jgi:hypothetical protein
MRTGYKGMIQWAQAESLQISSWSHVMVCFAEMESQLWEPIFHSGGCANTSGPEMDPTGD